MQICTGFTQYDVEEEEEEENLHWLSASVVHVINIDESGRIIAILAMENWAFHFITERPNSHRFESICFEFSVLSWIPSPSTFADCCTPHLNTSQLATPCM